MNEPITTPRRPAEPFAKTYRPAVLALLIVLIAIQIFTLVSDYRRDAQCKQSIAVLSKSLEVMSDQYQAAVYGDPKVDNINKQQLRAAEFQFLAQQATARIILTCH